jgi:hypothetical protein
MKFGDRKSKTDIFFISTAQKLVLFLNFNSQKTPSVFSAEQPRNWSFFGFQHPVKLA